MGVVSVLHSSFPEGRGKMAHKTRQRRIVSRKDRPISRCVYMKILSLFNVITLIGRF